MIKNIKLNGKTYIVETEDNKYYLERIGDMWVDLSYEVKNEDLAQLINEIHEIDKASMEELKSFNIKELTL